MPKYLDLQQAQFVGDYTETIDIEIRTNTDWFAFPTVSEELKKADIIGVALLCGDGVARSIVTNQLLLTPSQMSGCILQIDAKNRKKTNIPLRLFNMDGKPQIYLPISIQSINAQQSKIIFPSNSTVSGIVQLVFFSAQ